jgi:hypothetical protein
MVVAPDRIDHSTRIRGGCHNESMGTGIITFCGAAALSFMTFFAGPQAKKVWDQKRYLWSYLWWLIGLVPIGFVCLGWAHTEDQPMWVIRPIIFIIGALIGGTGALAIAEYVYPKANAQASNQPSAATQAPVVNQGPGSAYSTGQQGGVTAGTVNIGPIPRRLPPDKIAGIRDKLTGVHLSLDVVVAGGRESKQFAEDIINAISVPGINITDRLNFDLMPGWEGVTIYDPEENIVAIRDALTAANIHISPAQNRPGQTPYPPKTPALIIAPQSGAP